MLKLCIDDMLMDLKSNFNNEDIEWLPGTVKKLLFFTLVIFIFPFIPIPLIIIKCKENKCLNKGSVVNFQFLTRLWSIPWWTCPYKTNGETMS